MLHVLGFDHEQSRPDRDDYVTIKWENMKKVWMPQYLTNDHIDSLGAPYDYYSVMHYKAYTGSKNGEITMDAGSYTNEIGLRNYASDGDVSFLIRLLAFHFFIKLLIKQ
jgi:hypothetical protein